MNMKMTMAAIAAAAACAGTALADFTIGIDAKAKPLKDQRQSTCAPVIGYAGSLADMWEESDDYWFVSNKLHTAEMCRKAGAWFLRVWSANDWWRRGQPEFLNDPKRKGHRSNPKAAFEF